MKKRIITLMLCLCMVFVISGCSIDQVNPSQFPVADDILNNATEIVLSDEEITVDGSVIPEDMNMAVYKANDIIYYEEGHDFTYGNGTAEDEHSAEEATAHTVVHITEPGAYSLRGNLSLGQIAVDLGEDATDNPEAVVSLVLNGVDIKCSVAPAVIFYNVYECGSKEESDAKKDVDTIAAGANVFIVDGSENNIDGSYVAKIYKSYELSEDGKEVINSKKLHKYDGAFYSKMSMNIFGGVKNTGVLNIKASNEGLDSELHLTINGGNTYITAGNDGINTNEDGISVTTINGGTLDITVDGSTGEGDGIDSNGWIVINGGYITASACSFSADSGIDSDLGIHINGGTVIASGNMLDSIAESNQEHIVMSFRQSQSGQKTYTIKNSNGETVIEYTPANDFTVLMVSDKKISSSDEYTIWQEDNKLEVIMRAEMDKMKAPMKPGENLPENSELGKPPEGLEPPDGFNPKQDMKPPEGFDFQKKKPS